MQQEFVAFDSAKPLISVTVVSSASFSGLEETLWSVAKQTYARVECIVVEGVFAPEQPEQTREYGSLIVRWLSAPPQHEAALLQHGLEQTTGQYVLVLASGQLLANDAVLTTLVAALDAETDVFYGNYDRRFPDGALSEAQFPDTLATEDVLGITGPRLAATLVRKTVFEKHGFWDDRLRYTHEWAFFVRVLLQSSAVARHAPLCVASLPVGRHGDTSKLSHAHLTNIEKTWVREHLLAPLLNQLVRDKQYYEAAYQRSSRLPFVAGLRQLKQTMERAFGPALRQAKYRLRTLRTEVDLPAYRRRHEAACRQIPIVINNRNHVSYLQRLIASLEQRGYHNLVILDNASDYPPLLEYYARTPHRVIRLGDNVGFCALWETAVFDNFRDSYYVYTDSDLELVDECPADFIVVMHYLLNRYNCGKVGFSLLTDDLPDHYANKGQVQGWEAQFQQHQLERLAFAAPIDTTFALYKPNTYGHAAMLSGLRTSFPYSARHLPWYEATAALTPEQRYYYQHATTSSHWSSQVQAKQEQE